MTKQQKEVAQLKREVWKLERDNQRLETKIHDLDNTSRYWQREYNRLLNEIQTKFVKNSKEAKPYRAVRIDRE